MITAMVAGYYEPNGNEVYPPGSDAYGEYCYGVQDMCNHMPCSFHGPPGVRMLSNNNGMPVPMQVPPGHLVQQVVDENGTVRHFLLSPPLPMPVGAHHYSPSHASSAPMATPPYYPYPQPTYAAPPHYQPQPPSHMQPAMNPQNLHGMMHISQCNGQSPQGLCEDTSPPPSQLSFTQKEERFQRQTYKFRRKLEGRTKEKIIILPSQAGSLVKREKRRYRHDDSFRINGSSASGSNASEDEDVTWIFTEYLSNMRPPVVSELSTHSVMVCWKPPEVPAIEVDATFCASMQQSEILYEVMLCEKGKEGRYKTVYSGMDHHCNITSLKPSTEYYVCVQASVEDIRGSTIKGPTFKTQSNEPETPQPPRLYARTKNSLTLKWNPTSDSAKTKTYILEFDEGYSRNNFVPVYTGPLKVYKVTKLTPATGYKFRLAAVNEKGKSTYSEPCCFYTSGNVPSQPAAPTLRQAHINRLHLEWEKRSSDDDFRLQIEDENARQGFLTAYSGRENNFVCCGLRGNTEYKFRLCANNEEGPSLWSKTVTYCTLPDKLSCPGKPIPKGRIHASCFRVTWDPPRDYKQSSITKYILEVDRGFGFESVYTGPDTEFFLENLLPGAIYKLRVACISSAGHSPYSEVNSITTAAVSPGKCALPKLQSKPEASFVCLDWAHPEHDGGSSVAEYEVDMTSPDNVTLQVYKGTETSCIVNGLLPGRPYLFQVRAYNRVGAGPWSEPLEVVSGAGPPDAPRNLTVVLSAAPPACGRISWDEPLNNGAAITSYQLHWSTEDDEESYTELYEGSSLNYEVQGLSPATLYYFKVKAVNEAGAGPASDVVTCETAAAVPGVISVVNTSATSSCLFLSWCEPLTNGLPILSYNVELDDFLYSTEESVPELCIEDLSPETAYRVRVQAVNAVGEGPFSQVLQATTMKSPPEPPSLECAAVSHNCLRLRWGEGKNDEATCFTLEMSSKSKSFVPIYHGTALSHKVSRLQESTVYQFRVCAASSCGQGPFSPAHTFHTTRAPPPSLRAPKVSIVGERSCQVEWSGAKQLPGNYFSYQLHMSTANDTSTVYEGPETRCTVDNLLPSSQYSFRVAAVRHCTGAEDLTGPLSTATLLCTPSPSHTPDTTRVPPPPSGATHHNDRRTVGDRHTAAILVAAFTSAGFLLAALVENVFGLSGAA